MRVALPIAGGTGGVRRTTRPMGGGPSFAIGMPADPAEAGESRAATAAAAPMALASLDLLLAAQEVDGPTQRRRRAFRRGQRLVDSLDELQMALLDGSLSPASLGTLRRLAAEQIDDVADPALAATLKAIDLRAAVELAKIEYAIEARHREAASARDELSR